MISAYQSLAIGKKHMVSAANLVTGKYFLEMEHFNFSRLDGIGQQRVTKTLETEK